MAAACWPSMIFYHHFVPSFADTGGPLRQKVNLECPFVTMYQIRSLTCGSICTHPIKRFMHSCKVLRLTVIKPFPASVAFHERLTMAIKILVNIRRGVSIVCFTVVKSRVTAPSPTNAHIPNIGN